MNVTNNGAQTTIAQSPTLAGCSIFPPNNIWNTPITNLPLDPNSTTYISSIGANVGLHPDVGSGLWDGGPIGIPYVVVPRGQAKVPISFTYHDESDPGPYPIPPNPPIEGGPNSNGDRHILVVEQGTCKLYETWSTYPNADGSWRAGSGAMFDLRSNALRPDTWTSADAAGLPILPGLVRRDEVVAGEIKHALRFTVQRTRRSYVWPARHQAGASTDPSLPPMGQRFRLKASYDISGFSRDARIILQALKTYGMILADNGSNWYISGVPDEGWDNDLLAEIKQVRGSDFEAVDSSLLRINDSAEAAQDSQFILPGAALQGQQVSVTIQVVADNTTVALESVLPNTLTLVSGSLTTTAGVPAATYDSGTRRISWSGTQLNRIVTITYQAIVGPSAAQFITVDAALTHGTQQRVLTSVIVANPQQVFLPSIQN